jgi:hypothetical protein
LGWKTTRKRPSNLSERYFPHYAPDLSSASPFDPSTSTSPSSTFGNFFLITANHSADDNVIRSLKSNAFHHGHNPISRSNLWHTSQHNIVCDDLASRMFSIGLAESRIAYKSMDFLPTLLLTQFLGVPVSPQHPPIDIVECQQHVESPA